MKMCIKFALKAYFTVDKRSMNEHSLNFSGLRRALNLILLTNCSERQKLLEVARTTKSCC